MCALGHVSCTPKQRKKHLTAPHNSLWSTLQNNRVQQLEQWRSAHNEFCTRKARYAFSVGARN